MLPEGSLVALILAFSSQVSFEYLWLAHTRIWLVKIKIRHLAELEVS